MPDTIAVPEVATRPLEAVEPPKLKDRRALSAFRHGITGQVVLVTQADQVAYDEHCQGYFRTYNPQTPVARDLVQLVADDRWRLKIAASLESAMLADEMMKHSETICENDEVNHALIRARAWSAKGGNLNLLSVYSSRLQKQIDRNIAELRRHEADYAARLENAFEEAELLTEEAERNGEDVDSWIGGIISGFVFSIRDMKAMLLRRRTLAKAREHRIRQKKAA